MKLTDHTGFAEEQHKLETVRNKMAELEDRRAEIYSTANGDGAGEPKPGPDAVAIAVIIANGGEVPAPTNPIMDAASELQAINSKMELLRKAEQCQATRVEMIRERASAEILRTGPLGGQLRTEIAKQNEIIAALVASNSRLAAIRRQGFEDGIATAFPDMRFLAGQMPHRFDHFVHEALKRVV